jgi:hypothetical protein
MKIKVVFLLFTISLFLLNDCNSQDIWIKLEKTAYSRINKEVYKKKNFPLKYELVSLDVAKLKHQLSSLSKNSNRFLNLPNSKGVSSKFEIKETSNLASELAAKFPMIKSYSAQGIDDPTAVAKLSFGTDGFHAIIFSGKEQTVYLDPYSKDNQDYIVYKRGDLADRNDDFSCKVEASATKVTREQNFARKADDGMLRTFRLALVCSAEYAQFHLTQQGVAGSATNAVKKAAVLSAMNTSMTRINGVYEKDLGVRMELVANNDTVIFLDTATDGISDINEPDIAYTIIGESQTICDAQIGDMNYDIGHIFTINGSGLAGLGVVCITGQKGLGVTGIAIPTGDPYEIDYVSHEIGHQFGANHTQNNECNRNDMTAVEPGSASTIMGYAGICPPNVQNNSDDHFHSVSVTEMWNSIQAFATCGNLMSTTNTAPTANAGADYSIPKSTPFVLRGIATDADGMASLTYSWEQIDIEIATMPPLSTNTGGPAFRSLPSKTSPDRYMPDLSTVIGGSVSSTWEVVPAVARDLNFSFLVSDNYAGGGNSAREDMTVTVTNAEAFTVSAPNTAVSWDVGTTQAITWNIGTTDAAPINCANVNIILSIDAGVTFPIILKSNTANDGSEEITIPYNFTTTARIMVEAADNIFYNVNAVNFTINQATASIEDLLFNGLKLYPNPTKGVFTLSLEVLNTAKLTLQLFDVRGRLIGEKEYLNTKNNFSENVFFKNTTAGLYLVKITNGSKQTTRKLMIN